MIPTIPHFRNLTLQRLRSVEPERAQGRTKELFETVRQAFGMIPYTARVMANSPAVLESFLAFNSAMAGLKIGNGLHTQVKLATSETNACEYCTSILTLVAPSAGLSAGDILAGRTGVCTGCHALTLDPPMAVRAANRPVHYHFVVARCAPGSGRGFRRR